MKRATTHDVIRSDPAHPTEHAQSLEQVPRQEVPEERTQERVQEETFSRDTTAVTHTGVHL